MPAPARHLSIGATGEAVAARYLKRKGFSVLEHNYRNPTGRRLGEIDIIAEKDGEIVFVEVKTRHLTGRMENAPLPEENITPRKLHKLEKIARYYLRVTGKESSPYRFDAVSVLYSPEDRQARIRHLEYIYL